MALEIAVEHRRRDFVVTAQFTAPTPGITVLFGPSGAGKSTVLEAVAGLLRANHTRVDLNGERLDKLPAHRRRIGMVFQDGRLFPHMKVEWNLVYGFRRAPGGQVLPGELADLLDLHKLMRRQISTLSGGERQRVAIARALLSQPRLLLMDEPLASLDGPRRQEIMPYLQRLRDTLRMPVLYVTHATDEVYRLADQVVLMEAGQVIAAGPLPELAARVDLALAARDDAAGVLLGYVHRHEPERGLTSVACGGEVYLVPLCDVPAGNSVRLRIPAREVILALDAPRHISVNNIIPAVVSAIRFDGATHAALVEIDVGGGQLLSRITTDAAERLHLRPGVRVLGMIKSMSVELL
jgi:molybdate transport system ATP-binding protein